MLHNTFPEAPDFRDTRHF